MGCQLSRPLSALLDDPGITALKESRKLMADTLVAALRAAGGGAVTHAEGPTWIEVDAPKDDKPLEQPA